MLKQLNRYHHPDVIAHLASQYVLGLLPIRVRRRVEQLRTNNIELEQGIALWQQRFIDLDIHCPDVTASTDNWQKITAKLALGPTNTHIQNSHFAPNRNEHSSPEQKSSPELNKTKVSSQASGLNFVNRIMMVLQQLISKVIPQRREFSAALSIFAILLFSGIGYFSFNKQVQHDSLSYVAVLTDQQQQAHLVASTYGQSKQLTVQVIAKPAINEDQSLELWVVSKTDGQARSLGLISAEQSVVSQQLSTAQWRLIKDSKSLLVTLEELGGSAIGEPSDLIVSRGLCIRLTAWNNNEQS